MLAKACQSFNSIDFEKLSTEDPPWSQNRGRQSRLPTSEIDGLEALDFYVERQEVDAYELGLMLGLERPSWPIRVFLFSSFLTPHEPGRQSHRRSDRQPSESCSNTKTIH